MTKFTKEHEKAFNLIIVDDEKPCWVCKELTNAIDICLESRICSVECSNIKWKEIGEDLKRLESMEEEI